MRDYNQVTVNRLDGTNKVLDYVTDFSVTGNILLFNLLDGVSGFNTSEIRDFDLRKVSNPEINREHPTWKTVEGFIKAGPTYVDAIRNTRNFLDLPLKESKDLVDLVKAGMVTVEVGQ